MSNNPSIDIEQAIELASQQVINARDFCGNEREAAADALSDCGLKPTRALMAEVMAHANGEWRQHQRAAGVKKPIYPSERKHINKIMEGES